MVTGFSALISFLLAHYEVNEKNWYNLSLLIRALQIDFPGIYQLFNDFRLFNDSHFWTYQNNYHIWYKIILINEKIDRKWGFESCHCPLVAGEGFEPTKALLRCPKRMTAWSAYALWPLRHPPLAVSPTGRASAMMPRKPVGRWTVKTLSRKHKRKSTPTGVLFMRC